LVYFNQFSHVLYRVSRRPDKGSRLTVT